MRVRIFVNFIYLIMKAPETIDLREQAFKKFLVNVNRLGIDDKCPYIVTSFTILVSSAMLHQDAANITRKKRWIFIGPGFPAFCKD